MLSAGHSLWSKKGVLEWLEQNKFNTRIQCVSWYYSSIYLFLTEVHHLHFSPGGRGAPCGLVCNDRNRKRLISEKKGKLEYCKVKILQIGVSLNPAVIPWFT